jgi:hypothetical protein
MMLPEYAAGSECSMMATGEILMSSLAKILLFRANAFRCPVKARVKRELVALQIAALLLADESELPPKIPAQSAGMVSSQTEGITGSTLP